MYASPDSSCSSGRESVPTAAILWAKASRGTSSQMLIPLCIYFLIISSDYQLKFNRDFGFICFFFTSDRMKGTNQLMGLITAPPPVETTT